MEVPVFPQNYWKKKKQLDTGRLYSFYKYSGTYWTELVLEDTGLERLQWGVYCPESSLVEVTTIHTNYPTIKSQLC